MERYEKGRTLGEGTFGVVHEARVRELRRDLGHEDPTEPTLGPPQHVPGVGIDERRTPLSYAPRNSCLNPSAPSRV